MDRFCLLGFLSIFSYLPTSCFSLSFLGEPPATCKGTQADLLRDPPEVTLKTPTMSKIHLGNKSFSPSQALGDCSPDCRTMYVFLVPMYIGTKSGFVF